MLNFRECKAGDQIAVMKTNMGEVEILLFPEVAPKAVENFISLAKGGYYDGIIFHRVKMCIRDRSEGHRQSPLLRLGRKLLPLTMPLPSLLPLFLFWGVPSREYSINSTWIRIVSY